MHPNLCRTIEVGTTKEHGLFWFAMEYLDGRDLAQLLESGKVPSLKPMREVFRQTLDALTHVHARKFVHCDIKPANIFIATDIYDPGLKLVKLLDFGIARDLSDPTQIDSRRIYGDPYYMPPEQTIPGNAFDHRADLYALGMTFFEVVTGGRHPFEDLAREHPRELLRAQREREPAPPSSFLPPDYPQGRAADIDAFFLAACAKNPDHRFQSAKAMGRALLAIETD
jgi:serine/threonine-protein kinase